MAGRAGAPSRDQQAFRWLLSGDDEGEGRGRRQSGGAKDKAKAGGRRRGGADIIDKRAPFLPGFQLREDAAAAAAAAGPSAPPAPSLASLQAAFNGVLPPDLVSDVFASCGGDTTAAMEALLALAGGSAGEDQPEPSVTPQQAAAAAAKQRQRQQAAGSPAELCYLHVLPAEIKQLVFDQLSLRDLARAARACREFAHYVREQRRSLRTVVVPEGVSNASIRGLVSSFAGATGVSLSKCAAQLRFAHEFEEMMQAVARGEADRTSGVPVSFVSLAKCWRATDVEVATLCDTFPHLRRVDLLRCTEVSDAGMARLAAYSRQQQAQGGGASGDEEEGDPGTDTLNSEDGASVASATAAVEAWQFAGQGSTGGAPPGAAAGTAGAAAAAVVVPGGESPDSAVRRIAAQRHVDMLARSAAAAKAQHGRPVDCGLEDLCLKETSVSTRGIKLLLQPGSATSKSLKALDVSRCPNVAGDALDVHPRSVLQVLRASGCNGLRSVVIQLPADAPLKTLQLDSCRQLTEVVLVAHHLDSLNLSHCGQLRSVSLRCRRLRELRAVNCGSLDLEASELHCPALQELNLFGVRKLNAEGLEDLAPSLTKCARLDLTGCLELSRVLLPEATALQCIRVSGCTLLRQVLLASPALSEFRAAGCSRLVEVRLGTVSLHTLDLENCSLLREVQMSEGSGPRTSATVAAAAAGAGTASGGGGSVAKPKVVLRGCTSLPDATKKRLKEGVLSA